jgi:two-component system phosphate regulon sensor histidine kinase PhoR
VFDRLSRFTREEFEARSNMAAELERVRAAVHRMPDSLIVLDRSNRIEWYNRAAEGLLAIVGIQRPIYHFVRDPEFSTWLEEGAGAPLELTLPQRPGHLFSVRMFRSDETHRLLIAHDITEQRRLDAMRRDFVANISHEIRTPLTVISGFVETMLDLDLDDDSRRQYLDAIGKQSDTMRRLIEDLLILAKLEHDLPGDGENTPIDLHELLTILVGDARALSGGRHQISLRLAGARWLKVDAQDLQTVVRNLLTNAVRYTPEGGQVTVDWESQGTEALLCIRDTGIGIATEHIPRLTERFYRVDRGRSRDSGGTGLGLAIVKHALQRYGATL